MTSCSRPAQPRSVALIPARAGSKRIAHKNVRKLNGHPLMAYSIAAARQSNVFSAVVVSTDDMEIARIAREYGAETPFLRPADLAGTLAADIGWVQHAIHALQAEGGEFDCFSILRPTSPFRSAATIQRAWALFCDHPECDSLRAVEKCAQHPGKMWRIEDGQLIPLLDDGGVQPPWHSTPYQGLPEVYVQNASLEIAWNDVPLEKGTIAGDRLIPFVTERCEGFDINLPEDWLVAEHLISTEETFLPSID